MYRESWKFQKIEVSDFWEFSWKFEKTEGYNFCEISCTGGHENSRKLKHMIFENFNVPWVLITYLTLGHENVRKLKCSTFENFHVPGVMKIQENWSIWFLRIFMYRGLWKFKNIEVYDFCEISCTGGHENLRKLERSTFENFNVPRVMKIRQNWRILFLRIFMYQGSWKFKKIKGSYFCEVSCTGGHENERKLKRLTFEKFHVLGGHENSTKLKCLYFCEVSCIGGHENARKLKHMIFENFNVPGVMKMWENWSLWLLRILMYPGSWKCKKTEESYFWEFSCTAAIR